MRYFSMFAGVGGFEVALDRSLPGSECVGYSEIDKHAISTYERHFDHDNYGDAALLNPTDLPAFDLLVGGFPCQAFSIAGKREGFEDTRGTLFFDVARVLERRRPFKFILENVKGLLSHDGGRTFRTILETLTELGYGVEWQVLNAKDHGLAQNRERIFLIGHFGGFAQPEILPLIGEGSPYTTLGQSTETTVARTLTGGGNSGGNHSGMTILEQPFFVTRDRRTGESLYTPKTESNAIHANHSTGMDWRSHRTSVGELIGEELKLRRLTPIECERLQGFPDGWTAGVSDTQRYKQMGNAVPVNLAQAAIERLVRL